MILRTLGWVMWRFEGWGRRVGGWVDGEEGVV
jgi:hypothetical protein